MVVFSRYRPFAEYPVLESKKELLLAFPKYKLNLTLQADEDSEEYGILAVSARRWAC